MLVLLIKRDTAKNTLSGRYQNLRNYYSLDDYSYLSSSAVVSLHEATVIRLQKPPILGDHQPPSDPTPSAPSAAPKGKSKHPTKPRTRKQKVKKVDEKQTSHVPTNNLRCDPTGLFKEEFKLPEVNFFGNL